MIFLRTANECLRYSRAAQWHYRLSHDLVDIQDFANQHGLQIGYEQPELPSPDLFQLSLLAPETAKSAKVDFRCKDFGQILQTFGAFDGGPATGATPKDPELDQAVTELLKSGQQLLASFQELKQQAEALDQRLRPMRGSVRAYAPGELPFLPYGALCHYRPTPPIGGKAIFTPQNEYDPGRMCAMYVNDILEVASVFALSEIDELRAAIAHDEAIYAQHC